VDKHLNKYVPAVTLYASGVTSTFGLAYAVAGVVAPAITCFGLSVINAFLGLTLLETNVSRGRK
jgi:hypothetical protein